MGRCKDCAHSGVVKWADVGKPIDNPYMICKADCKTVKPDDKCRFGCFKAKK